jgi:hypothetical protein
VHSESGGDPVEEVGIQAPINSCIVRPGGMRVGEDDQRGATHF